MILRSFLKHFENNPNIATIGKHLRRINRPAKTAKVLYMHEEETNTDEN